MTGICLPISSDESFQSDDVDPTQFSAIGKSDEIDPMQIWQNIDKPLSFNMISTMFCNDSNMSSN